MKTAHTSFSSFHHFFFLFFLLSPNGPQTINHITLLSFANSCSSHQCLNHINSLLVCFYVCLFFTLVFQSKSLSTFQFVFFPVYIFKFLFKKARSSLPPISLSFHYSFPSHFIPYRGVSHTKVSISKLCTYHSSHQVIEELKGSM